jgi:hypothetical protein
VLEVSDERLIAMVILVCKNKISPFVCFAANLKFRIVGETNPADCLPRERLLLRFCVRSRHVESCAAANRDGATSASSHLQDTIPGAAEAFVSFELSVFYVK